MFLRSLVIIWSKNSQIQDGGSNRENQNSRSTILEPTFWNFWILALYSYSATTKPPRTKFHLNPIWFKYETWLFVNTMKPFPVLFFFLLLLLLQSTWILVLTDFWGYWLRIWTQNIEAQNGGSNIPDQNLKNPLTWMKLGTWEFWDSWLRIWIQNCNQRLWKYLTAEFQRNSNQFMITVMYEYSRTPCI